MGPPGAGKGTQAEGIVEALKIKHISTGDMFRAAIKEGTDMGKQAKQYMDKGELVPDSIVVGMVTDRICQADCSDGFLLDGFPRTIPQAEALDVAMKNLNIKVDGVINIAVPRENLMARLTGRRICSVCGASYHVMFNKPEVEGKCDKCGGELYQRSDDNEVAVGNRLDIYEAETQPLIDYYNKQGLMNNINGDQDIGLVLKDCLDCFKK